MTDYIERDAFRKELVNTPFHPRCKTTPDLLTSVQDRLNDTLEMLDNFPAADVRPVVRGKWVGGEFDGYADGYPVYETMLCSECGAEYDADTADTANYCPNCGAKMEVEHDSI